MCTRREQDQLQRELFQIDLAQLNDLKYPLVQLGMRIDWAPLEQVLGATYYPTHSAPGIAMRLMVALRFLKYLAG